MRKLTLLTGFAAGYVLGARAGRERYQEIVSMWQEFTGKPAVQSAAATAADTASSLYDSASTTVSEKVSDLKSGGDAGEEPGGTASGDPVAGVSTESATGGVYPSDTAPESSTAGAKTGARTGSRSSS